MNHELVHTAETHLVQTKISPAGDIFIDNGHTSITKPVPTKPLTVQEIFFALSQEGDHFVTDRRNRILHETTQTVDGKTVLNNTTKILFEKNKTVIGELYTEVITKQTAIEEDVTGSITALITVGKAMKDAGLFRRDELELIREQWEIASTRFQKANAYVIFNTANEFSEDNDIFLIKDKVVKHRAVTRARKDVVEQLRQNKLTHAEIAYELDLRPTQIDYYVRLLLKEKRIEPRPHGSIKTPENINRENTIVALRESGLSRSAIAKETGLSIAIVSHRIDNLIAKGELKKLEIQKPLRDEVVKTLILNRLTKKQIAYELDLPVSQINKSSKRLISKGELTRRRPGIKKDK